MKPYKNGCRYPQCKRRCRIVRQGREARFWEDVTLFGRKIILWYAPKEIVCPTHGRAQEAIAWAAAHARVTYRLEYRLCALCQIMTRKAAGAIYDGCHSEVKRNVIIALHRSRPAHAINTIYSARTLKLSISSQAASMKGSTHSFAA